MSENLQRIHAIVYGRVQGVSFRYYTTLKASGLGATGWVQNREDGSVEVMAEGTSEQLDLLVDFLRTGPSSAQGTRVELIELEANGEFSDFQVR